MQISLNDPDETELNMTPMIDIVFQLIVFFLLSLKFKSVDERIESMLPKTQGTNVTPVFVPDEDLIKLKVFRREGDTPEKAYTLVKVDNAEQFRLPVGWRGRAKESPERVRRYGGVLAAIGAVIDRRLQAYGGGAGVVKGEIKAPPPRGGSVPHGDVVALLDLFMAHGLTDVNFEGQAAPLTSRERAARNARR